ncbi:hypothetical protein FB45DRAFT_156528 [Roridomyces roridus]|uniref:Uncharacterized protein n=1 Tax=Roridomyces roridus TaxID=1738132 RepID=A0AAD7BFA8_9AGAR|nr:hypothetical protein FB45DRAFT_156528 [Roridomyces roridus]
MLARAGFSRPPSASHSSPWTTPSNHSTTPSSQPSTQHAGPQTRLSTPRTSSQKRTSPPGSHSNSLAPSLKSCSTITLKRLQGAYKLTIAVGCVYEGLHLLLYVPSFVGRYDARPGFTVLMLLDCVMLGVLVCQAVLYPKVTPKMEGEEE